MGGAGLAIDHVLVAVRDPSAWADRLRAEAGVVARPGGRHEGHGTGNWIVPLGASYLELITVVDAVEAENSQLGQWVASLTRDGDGLAAVCLRTDDIDAVGERLGLEPVAMERRSPTGEVLRWRLVGLQAAIAEEPLPFFIQWDPGTSHPGSVQEAHPAGVASLRSVAFAGRPEELHAWLGTADPPIDVVADATPGPHRFEITVGDATVTLDRDATLAVHR